MIHFPDETDASVELTVAELAAEAVHAAFRETRAQGLPVVVAEGNDLVQLEPDGRRTVLKPLPPLQQPARRELTIS